MREKWRVLRGWIKIHAMIDIRTDQILYLEVRDESVQDDPMFSLIRQRRTAGKYILSARSRVTEGTTGSKSSTPWKNKESNQEPKHGRMLLQEKPGLELYNTAASGGNDGTF